MSILRVDPFDCQMPFPLDERFSVPGLNDRNNLPTNSLWEGMNVWVASEGKEYKLVNKPNLTWQQVFPSTAPTPTVQNVVVNAGVPTNSAGNVGDIWVRTENTKTSIYQKTAPTTWTLKGEIPRTDVNEARVVGGSDININWQSDMAPDREGTPTDKTYVQTFGNRIPKVQVNMEVSPGVWSANEAVPVTVSKSAGDITTLAVSLSGINSEVIFT